ncbi:ABC-type transport auxiliary lipoprotein family protein [Sphingorhabdus arenilitoris]|uniref:ABC-type transport auxiliary lipoprotein family protein n=1 Tax=Sphingorhabdus arenilitoris TaxID=1490041 RepID=A0ABV8RF03_9SPHN
MKIMPALGALLPAILLSGCVSFGSKPPPSLLVLSATSSLPAGASHGGVKSEALVILTPTVPRKLDTNRVPVQMSSSSIAYLKDAMWSDKPASLMQQLLMETIAAKNDRLVLNESDAGGQAQMMLSGNLMEFGVDENSGNAVIIYDAVKLVRGEPVEKRRFEVRRPVSVIEPVPVGTALNEAANQLASDVAAWLKQ